MCTFQTGFHGDILEMKTTEERWKGQAEEEKEELQTPPPPPPPRPPGALFPGSIQLPPLIKMAKCTRLGGFFGHVYLQKCKTVETTVGQPDPGPGDPRMRAAFGTTVARLPEQHVRSQMSVPRNTLHRAKGKHKWSPLGNAD